MKEVTVTYTAEFTDIIEVDDDWEYTGDLDDILEHTDLPYTSGHLLDWSVR